MSLKAHPPHRPRGHVFVVPGAGRLEFPRLLPGTVRTALAVSIALLLDALLRRHGALWLAPEALSSNAPPLDRRRVERRYWRLCATSGSWRPGRRR